MQQPHQCKQGAGSAAACAAAAGADALVPQLSVLSDAHPCASAEACVVYAILPTPCPPHPLTPTLHPPLHPATPFPRTCLVVCLRLLKKWVLQVGLGFQVRLWGFGHELQFFMPVRIMEGLVGFRAAARCRQLHIKLEQALLLAPS